MVKRLLLTLILLTIPVLASGQATSMSKLLWDQSTLDLATANGYTYKYYPDNSTVGTVLTSVTCTGTASPFTCSVTFPTFTPGNHTLQLTATSIAGESNKSSPFAFNFVGVPEAPANIRIG